MLAKTMEQVTLDYPVEVVDIDENQELAIQYGIRGVPTLVLIENDAEVKRISGVQTEGFLKEWL
jgi:thioredoxin 1